MAGFVMLYIYTLQLISILYARETNILPATRALCTRWMWLYGAKPHGTGTWNWMQQSEKLYFKIMVDWWVKFIHDPYEDFNRYAKTGICDRKVKDLITGEHHSLRNVFTFWYGYDVAERHRTTVVIFLILMIGLLHVPPMLHWVGGKRKWWTKAEYDQVQPVDP